MVWTKPCIIVQVKFAEWTRGNVLRHAEFLGLRDDMDTSEAIRKASSIRGSKENAHL